MQNLGSTTWTTAANNFRLTFSVAQLVGHGGADRAAVWHADSVAPHASVDVPIQIAPIATSGQYTLRLDMVNPSGQTFSSTYGVPLGQFSFTVPTASVYAANPYPPANRYTDTLTPTLWADFNNPGNAGVTRQYQFKICNGTPAAPGACDETSTWQSSAYWSPSPALLSWGAKAFWQWKLSDGVASSADWSDAIPITPMVAQPTITSHLAGAPEGAEMPGVNP